MAEITKVTTPMIPKENLGNRNKPISDQAFDLTDPSKVHHSQQEHSHIRDHQRDGQAAMREGVLRELAPILKDTTELTHIIQKVTTMLQMGISTSEIMENNEMRALLDSVYLQPEQLAQALKEQDGAAVLFKGATFDLLRDILNRFPDNARVRNAVSHLLKTFEQNVNAENSVKTILHASRHLLDYMFSGDRAQFAQYLDGLEEMLLPAPQPAPEQPEAAAQAQAQADQAVLGEETVQQEPAPQQTEGAGRALGMEQREAAQVLKGNLLPLLGEIVVKYNQNARIRDSVMVVVHNIVRVDQGTPESLQSAIAKLVSELKLIANLPENFEQQLTNALFAAKEQAQNAQDTTTSKLASLIAQALSSPNTNAATLRQAENMLVSMLQNQNSMMNILHFMLPVESQSGKLFAELYVDPDNDEKVGRSKENSRKVFLAFDSENLGAFELCFLEAEQRVDFSMWCPEPLVKNLGALKRHIGDLMQMHGYTMNSYQVEQLIKPKSIAEVFPRLLERKVGVDVRI